jgi:hypothetical protein
MIGTEWTPAVANMTKRGVWLCLLAFFLSYFQTATKFPNYTDGINWTILCVLESMKN